MEPFKELFKKELIENISVILAKEVTGFNKNNFLNDVLDSQWTNRELKERMRHITVCLNKHLPFEYEKQIGLLRKIAGEFKGITGLVLSDFVEQYGIEHFELSMEAFEEFTSRGSSEFAVRPFIVKYNNRMMKQMKKWSKHPDEHVRRLSSEGCRPRLPWSFDLEAFKKDPEPVLSILENLKNDKSEYVRKSVANNLNDISKDNPEIVINIAKEWYGKTNETNKLIKHSLRTLLKKGNPEALKITGINHSSNIEILNCFIDKKNVELNESAAISFIIKNNDKEKQLVRSEYLFEFPGKNGSHNKKIFKISETQLEPGEEKEIKKNHKFQHQSIRQLLPGEYFFTLIINGKPTEKLKIVLNDF